MAFGRKSDPAARRSALAGGALYVPASEEVEAILARAGQELGEPDLELLETVREHMALLDELLADGEEAQVFARLDALIGAVDVAVPSTKVRHAAKVAARNVLARCGIRPIRVGPGDPLARLDRIEVEVEETRAWSRRHDRDEVERIERRGYRLGSGEILRTARVVASAGRRPELLDLLDDVRRFRSGLAEPVLPVADLLHEFDSCAQFRREDLVALAQRTEEALGGRGVSADGVSAGIRANFLEPIERVLAVEALAEPFGEEGADPKASPEGAIRIEKEDYAPGLPRGRIARVLVRGWREPRSGRILAPARVTASRGEPPDMARSIHAVAAAAQRLASTGRGEAALRLVGSLEGLAHRSEVLGPGDLSAVTSALADLQAFLAEFVFEEQALSAGDGAVTSANDLVVDLSIVLEGWGYHVFPDPRTADPSLLSVEALRRALGENAIEVDGVFDDRTPAGSVLFVRAHGFSNGTDGLLHPACLAVSLGPRPPVLETVAAVEARLGDLGESADVVRERLDRFKESLSGETDWRALVRVVNLLDAALVDAFDPGLDDLVERLVAHLREGGIEEYRIDRGIVFDALPPDYCHVRKVTLAGSPENEVVRVLQRAFRDKAGLLLQQARIEVSAADGRG